MPISLDNLSPHDFKIIEYINKFESVSKNQIIEQFENQIDSIELRLSLLSERSYINRKHTNLDTGYIIEEYDLSNKTAIGAPIPISKNSYHVSPYGKKILQDYLTKQKNETRNLWLKSAWIPIITAFITTLLTNYILPMLPQILKWLTNIL